MLDKKKTPQSNELYDNHTGAARFFRLSPLHSFQAAPLFCSHLSIQNTNCHPSALSPVVSALSLTTARLQLPATNSLFLSTMLHLAAMSVICKKRRRKLHSDAKGIMDHEPKLYQSQFLSMDLMMNH